MLQLLGDVPRTDRHAAGAVWDGPQDRPSLGYQEEYQEEYREDYREDYRKDDVRAGREQLLDEFTGLKAACDRGGREQLASEGTAAERAVLEHAGRRLDELAEAAAAAAAEAEAEAEAAEVAEAEAAAVEEAETEALQGMRAQAPRLSTSPFAPRPSTSPAISGSDASEVFFSPSESVPESPPLESPGGECPPPAASPVGDAVEEEE